MYEFIKSTAVQFSIVQYYHTHKQLNQKTHLEPCKVTFIPDMLKVHHRDENWHTHITLEKKTNTFRNAIQVELNWFADRAVLVGMSGHQLQTKKNYKYI